jgi:mannose-1-phosphate guanylyltransferase / mannose-6-phosphate isomerase
MHEKVERPWGHYEILKEGEGFKVKSIVVEPGQRLSLQRHKHREENWIVVQGIARVTVNNNVVDYKPGEHVKIPKGSIHRLENPEKGQVEIIEVQNGDYLGEDDIERLEDDYDRQN